eukprot:5980499-Alexandrium_andersonii.AAC.1
MQCCKLARRSLCRRWGRWRSLSQRRSPLAAAGRTPGSPAATRPGCRRLPKERASKQPSAA